MKQENLKINRGVKSFKYLYYHKPSLEKLFKLANNATIRQEIKNRLNNFSARVKGFELVGWTYHKEVNKNNIKYFDNMLLSKALREEKAFLVICKPLIFKYYKELGIYSLKNSLDRIDELLKLIEINNGAGNEDWFNIKNAESFLKIAVGFLGVIGTGYTLYEKMNRSRQS